MDALIEKSLTVAPFMVIALTGVGYIARMFLKHITEAEQQRRDWATDRHKEFFQVVTSAQDRANMCIEKNTEVMGKVLDRVAKDS